MKKPSCLIKSFFSCLLFFALVGCARPLLYKPKHDMEPLLKVPLPSSVGTISAIPSGKVICINGINGDKTRRTDGIKDFVVVSKGDDRYEFQLFFDENDAKHQYEANKNYPFAQKHYPVFREVNTADRSGYVCLTEQERADPEGGSVPMGVYTSRACFRLHNLVIEIKTSDDKPQSESLNRAIVEVANMLQKAVSNH